MVTFDLELARRFDMPLVRGMRLRPVEPTTYRGDGCIYLRATASVDHDWVTVQWDGFSGVTLADPRSIVLDYTDPGTLGHVLAAVRAAWGQPGAFTCCGEDDNEWAVMVAWGVNCDAAGHGPTEAHALAAAWEGRP